MSCTFATYRFNPPIEKISLCNKDAGGPIAGGPTRKHILKLRVLNLEGSSQIRRVRLPQIQINGKICYSALVYIAIKYTFPGTLLVPDDYSVIFTYYDIDNDCVTISSTKELVDAIGQFASPKDENICLRISAHVQEKNLLQIEKSCVSSKVYYNSKDKENAKGNHLTQSKGVEVTSPHNIVESFVSAFTKIIDNLQNQKNAEEEEITETKKITDVKKNVLVSKTNKTTIMQQREKSKLPFLHCRHTCDGCLSTPIVGKRYHAINVVDFDLCTACRKNYSGDVMFAIVELERDRKFQNRWYQKFGKIVENNESRRNEVCSQ